MHIDHQMNQICDLPIEIVDIILKYRATLELQDLCKKNMINFEKLCYFLIKYQGVLIGSSATHCFSYNDYNDIDIFIYHNDYKNDPNLIHDIQSTIPLYKMPIFLKRSHNKFGVMDLSILQENVKKNAQKYVDIECTRVMFNGIDWDVPCHNNILEYFEKKITKITYFKDNIINMAYNDDDQELLDYMKIRISKMILPEIITQDEGVRSYYNKLRRYYSEIVMSVKYIGSDADCFYRLPDEYIDSFNNKVIICNMCALYDEITKLNGSDVKIWGKICDEIIKHLENNDPLLDDNLNDIFKKIYNMYLLQYRVLKYMSRGYKFTNLNSFLNNT